MCICLLRDCQFVRNPASHDLHLKSLKGLPKLYVPSNCYTARIGNPLAVGEFSFQASYLTANLFSC